MDDQNNKFLKRLISIEKNMFVLLDKLGGLTDSKGVSEALTKLSVDERITTKLNASNKKFEREIIYMKLEIDRLFKTLNNNIDGHMSEVKSTVALNESTIRSHLNESNLISSRELDLIRKELSKFHVRFDKIESGLQMGKHRMKDGDYYVMKEVKYIDELNYEEDEKSALREKSNLSEKSNENAKLDK